MKTRIMKTREGEEMIKRNDIIIILIILTWVLLTMMRTSTKIKIRIQHDGGHKMKHGCVASSSTYTSKSSWTSCP